MLDLVLFLEKMESVSELEALRLFVSLICLMKPKTVVNKLLLNEVQQCDFDISPFLGLCILIGVAKGSILIFAEKIIVLIFMKSLYMENIVAHTVYIMTCEIIKLTYFGSLLSS